MGGDPPGATNPFPTHTHRLEPHQLAVDGLAEVGEPDHTGQRWVDLTTTQCF